MEQNAPVYSETLTHKHTNANWICWLGFYVSDQQQHTM